MNEVNSKVMLEDVRLAFPVLNKPEAFQGEGKPRYSATLLMEPDSPNYEKCKAAIIAVAKAKWGDKAAAIYKSLVAGNKIAFADGNLKSEYDGFPGNWFVSAHSQAGSPPRLLDGAKRELPRDTGVIYAGCFVNASVEFWAQDNQWGKRINATIRGVQFRREGNSFSASRPADIDEFEVVEAAGETATDADFGGDTPPGADDLA
jgi:hypothetical protein